MKQPQQAEERRTMPHLLTVNERKLLEVSGVLDVDSFDGLTVIVYTELGELTVKGHQLHIRHLNVENGDLCLEGEIDSLTYSELQKHTGGFFGKLFR